MKKITFLSILFLFGNLVVSQSLYSNYLNMTSEWRNLSGGWNGISGYSNYTTTYFDGLETINGQVYYKRYSKNLYNSADFFGNPISELTLSDVVYFREDINGKFYILNTTTNLEEIVFDNLEILNSQVGDLFPYPGSSCTIQSIETLYLGTVPLKKVNGITPIAFNGSVEGIGFVGLACGTGIEFSSNLICYTKNNITLLFGNTNCNMFPIPTRTSLNVENNNIVENNYKIFPNPTKDIFKIINPLNMESTYEIYNSFGAKITKGNFNDYENTINLSNFENGLYLLKIQNNVSVTNIKILKE